MEKIMCALSGGGFRATFFHAGVLRALIRLGLKNQIAAISTVSGGSITGALFVLLFNHIRSLDDFDRLVIAPLINLSNRRLGNKLLLHKIARLPTHLLSTVLDLMGLPHMSLDKHNSTALFIAELDAALYTNATLAQLPEYPRLHINTTNLNNGSRWRFTQGDFGDYKTGYSYDTDRITLAEAVAASAGYPLLFPPYRLMTDECAFYIRNQSNDDIASNKGVPATIFLSDGGIYDNLGIHALKHQLSINKDSFLLISDASSSLRIVDTEYGYISACKRNIDILLEQVVSRDRQIILFNFAHNIWRGIFFRLENTTKHYKASRATTAEYSNQFSRLGLSEDLVRQIRNISTNTTVFTPQQLGNILLHGETLTETLLAKWHPQLYLQLLQAPAYIPVSSNYHFLTAEK